MNTSDNHIEQMLAEWGSSQRQMPERTESLKMSVLEKLASQDVPARPIFSRLPWLSIASAGLAVVVFFVFLAGDSGYKSESVTSASLQTPLQAEKSTAYDTAAGSASSNASPELYYRTAPVDEAPAGDGREYLKTSYSAEIKSRKVLELGARLQTVIRGHGGRIDSASLSKESGSISFVVPLGSYDALRNEIASIAGTRFITESVYSENLLPQKRSIEERKAEFETILHQLNVDREKLTAEHAAVIVSLQSQISATNQRIAGLQMELGKYPEREAEIQTQIRAAQNKRAGFYTQLNNEHSSYANKLESVDSQITSGEQNLKSVTAEDTRLVDTVQTVRGTLSLSKIGIWGVLNLYLPSYWAVYFLLALSIGLYFWHRKRMVY